MDPQTLARIDATLNQLHTMITLLATCAQGTSDQDTLSQINSAIAAANDMAKELLTVRATQDLAELQSYAADLKASASELNNTAQEVQNVLADTAIAQQVINTAFAIMTLVAAF